MEAITYWIFVLLQNYRNWLIYGLIDCADGVSTFQGKRTGVVQQLKMNYNPRIIGIHCMVRISLLLTFTAPCSIPFGCHVHYFFTNSFVIQVVMF